MQYERTFFSLLTNQVSHATFCFIYLCNILYRQSTHIRCQTQLVVINRAKCQLLGKQHICVWDGNFYAQGLCKQLGVLDKGGVVRIGCMHYNTTAELDKLFDLFDELLG